MQRPRFLSNDVERSLGDAGIDHPKRFGRSQGEVNDTAVDKWSTVIDPDSYTLSIHKVCHAQMRAEGQRGMRRAKSTPIEPFSARGVLVVRIEAGKSDHRASPLREHFTCNARLAKCFWPVWAARFDIDQAGSGPAASRARERLGMTQF